MNPRERIRVAVNGYGVIGKRVADAVALQPDMTLAGGLRCRCRLAPADGTGQRLRAIWGNSRPRDGDARGRPRCRGHARRSAGARGCPGGLYAEMGGGRKRLNLSASPHPLHSPRRRKARGHRPLLRGRSELYRRAWTGLHARRVVQHHLDSPHAVGAAGAVKLPETLAHLQYWSVQMTRRVDKDEVLGAFRGSR